MKGGTKTTKQKSSSRSIRQTIQFLNMVKYVNRDFAKEDIQVANNLMTGNQSQQPIRKCKSKPQ
jgi:hypothetical protein